MKLDILKLHRVQQSGSGAGCFVGIGPVGGHFAKAWLHQTFGTESVDTRRSVPVLCVFMAGLGAEEVSNLKLIIFYWYCRLPRAETFSKLVESSSAEAETKRGSNYGSKMIRMAVFALSVLLDIDFFVRFFALFWISPTPVYLMKY